MFFDKFPNMYNKDIIGNIQIYLEPHDYLLSLTINKIFDTRDIIGKNFLFLYKNKKKTTGMGKENIINGKL